mgnify:CR=1 FL=1
MFAVLSPSGMYYGELSLDPGIADEADHLVKHHLLPAAALQPQQAQQSLPAPAEAPLSLVGRPFTLYSCPALGLEWCFFTLSLCIVTSFPNTVHSCIRDLRL